MRSPRFIWRQRLAGRARANQSSWVERRFTWFCIPAVPCLLCLLRFSMLIGQEFGARLRGGKGLGRGATVALHLQAMRSPLRFTRGGACRLRPDFLQFHLCFNPALQHKHYIPWFSLSRACQRVRGMPRTTAVRLPLLSLLHVSVVCYSERQRCIILHGWP